MKNILIILSLICFFSCKQNKAPIKDIHLEIALDEYADGIIKLQHSPSTRRLIDQTIDFGLVENESIKLEYVTKKVVGPGYAYSLILTIKSTGERYEIVLPGKGGQ